MDRMLFGVVVAVSVAIVAASVTLSAPGVDHTKDTPDEVRKAVADGKAVLIDVRETDEWKEGHLKDALHLSLSELKAGVPTEKLKSLLPSGKIAYLHCASGRRSLKAADLLKTAGFETKPLQPGYVDLLKAGFEKAK